MSAISLKVALPSSLAFFLMLPWLILLPKDGSAQGSEIKQLIDAVQSAPALYRTPEAVSYFSRMDAPAASQEEKDAAIEGLRAAIKLGAMESRAMEAVPTLVNHFLKLEHVIAKRSVHFTPGNGTLEDWVQTYVVSEKSRFIFSSPFVEYSTISPCENWIEAQPVTTILSKKVGKGGKILDAIADIFIILRVNAGACALARITGTDKGGSQESWRTWYEAQYGAGDNGGSRPVFQSSPTPDAVASSGGRKNSFPGIVAGGRYKLHLVTNEDLVGEVTSRDDSSIVLKTGKGAPYNFTTVLIEKYEPLSSSDQAMVDTGANHHDSGELSFDDLLKGDMIGKSVEIRTRNGSILKGTLAQANGNSARITIDGSDITVARGVIFGIRMVIK
jgi:hypothetical protein